MPSFDPDEILKDPNTKPAVSYDPDEVLGGDKPPAENYSVGGFLGNLASSAGNLIGNTVKGVGDAAKYAVDNPSSLVPPLAAAKMMYNDVAHPQEAMKSLHDQGSQYWDALKSMGSRYSPSNIGSTLYHDPVGVAADASTLLDGAGLGLKLGAKGAELAGMAGAASKASKVGDALSVASDVTNPVGAISRPLAAGARRIQGALSDTAMKSAINDTKTLISEKVQDTANQMRAQKSTVTPKGLSVSDSIRQPAMDDVQRQITEAHNAGAMVDPKDVRQPVVDLINQKAQGSLGSLDSKRLNPIQNVLEGYDANHGDIPYTLDEAQKAKTQDYKDLNYNRPMVDDPFEDQARKALAHGQMKAIEDSVYNAIGEQHPTLHESNATVGTQNNIRKVIQQALLDKESGNSGRMNLPHGYSPHGVAFSGARNFVSSILSNPKVKSQIAIGLDSARNATGSVAKAGLNRGNLRNLGQASKYSVSEVPQE